MTIPEFKKYGVLKYLQFRVKQKPFNYIQMPEHLGKLENDKIKNQIKNSIFETYNNMITQKVEEVIETKQQIISTYVNNIKVHPLTDFTLDAQYTSLDSATKLVLEETTKIFLPTIKTKDLVKELFKRCLQKRSNDSR